MPRDSHIGWDQLILAKTIWGEARGESYQGQVAVAWTVRNRALDFRKRYGSSIADCCIKPFQFSCWNHNDPNYAVLSAGIAPDAPGWLRAQGIAALVMTGDIPDPTGGATHYHTMGINPSWDNDPNLMAPRGVIGSHVFFRER